MHENVRGARTRVRGGAAVAAVVLIGAGLGMPGAAQAASAPTDHACSVEGQQFNIAFGLDTDLPGSAPAGSFLAGNVTTSVDVPAKVAKTMSDFNIATFIATFRTTVSVGGVDVVSTSDEVTRAVDPGGFSVAAIGALGATAPATAGPSKIIAKNVQVTLKLRDAEGGNPLSALGKDQVVLECASPAGLVVDTLDIAGERQATRTSLSTSPKKLRAGRKGAVVVSVKGQSGAAPRGKVTVKVSGTSGGRRVALTKRVALVKGRATVSLGKLKKGKLTVVATYAGSASHAKSKVTKTFKVS